MPNPNLPISTKMNTYIGARYVPKFADTPGSEWDNAIAYEPFTIVLYQGNSFTSKTFVPVGVDINNSTYWAVTGEYNAQVEAYREQVINLTNTLSPIIEAVNKNVIKNYIFLGDSYQSGYFNGVEYALTSFLDVALPLVNLPDGSYWRAEGNGYGFVGVNNKKFIDLIQTLDSQITNKESITDIIVEGGLNDIGKDIQNNAQNFIDYVKSKYPNAKVYLIYPGQRLTDSNVLEIQTTITRYKNLGAIGYNWVNGFDGVLKNKNRYFSIQDNQHPTQNGQNALGMAFATWINTGECPFISQTQVISINKDSEIGNTSLVPNFYVQFTRESVIVQCSGYIQIKFNEPHILTYNEEITIGTFSGAPPVISNQYALPTFLCTSLDLPNANLLGRLYITGSTLMFNYVSPTQTQAVNSITLPNIAIQINNALA